MVSSGIYKIIDRILDTIELSRLHQVKQDNVLLGQDKRIRQLEREVAELTRELTVLKYRSTPIDFKPIEPMC